MRKETYEHPKKLIKKKSTHLEVYGVFVWDENKVNRKQRRENMKENE